MRPEIGDIWHIDGDDYHILQCVHDFYGDWFHLETRKVGDKLTRINKYQKIGWDDVVDATRVKRVKKAEYHEIPERN